MSDRSPTGLDALAAALASAERAIAAPNAEAAEVARALPSLLASLEAATPNGAPLHAQLDHIRRWITVLDDRSLHARFGGDAHVREQVGFQLRLASAALEDYRRASG